MRKFLPVLLTAILALCTVSAYAQGATLPTATTAAPHTITVPITTPGNCTATNTCIGTVYYQAAACPGTLAGSTGWTVYGTTFNEPGTASVTLSGVAASTTYAIDVEATPTGALTTYSGPSNCVTATTGATPFIPTPFVIGTPSAT